MFRFIFLLFLTFSISVFPQLKISTTIYPFKSILQEITGKRAEINVILPPSADPHTFELTTSDYKKILNSKVIFFGSENLDEWITKVESVKKIELIKLVPQKFLKNIIAANNKDYGTDPHFWTDPLTVKAMIPNLVEELINLDPQGKEIYKKNADSFSEKLINLDKKISSELAVVKNINVILSHPFFNYFLSRYEINVVGIVEISPGYQSTPKDIKRLLDISEEKKVQVIFKLINHPEQITKVFAETSGIKTVELDPFGGIEGRMTYVQLINYNAKKILNSLK